MENVEWLSPSACSTYLQCPLKFKFEKIDKRKTAPSDAMIRGRFVHSIIEGLLKLPVADRTLDSAKELARTLWQSEYVAETAPLQLDAKGVSSFKWEAWWCVSNYFDIEDPTTVSPMGTEKWVRGQVGEGKVRGIIDRYDKLDDGTVHIVDYKTGATPKKKEWADPYIFQLTIYAILLEEELRAKVPYASLYYLKDGNPVQYEITDKRRDSAEKSVTAIRRGIDERVANNSFEPITSRLCDWCSFKSICPAWGGKGE